MKRTEYLLVIPSREVMNKKIFSESKAVTWVQEVFCILIRRKILNT
jgi:hypothetical protein